MPDDDAATHADTAGDLLATLQPWMAELMTRLDDPAMLADLTAEDLVRLLRSMVRASSRLAVVVALAQRVAGADA